MIWQFQASQKDKVLGLLTDLTGASYANIKVRYFAYIILYINQHTLTIGFAEGAQIHRI